MSIRVIGAGLGRTGTLSLKIALERLLGAPCYHMFEVFSNLDHVPVWHRAVRGEKVNWSRLLDGWIAAVDEPAAVFWPELMDAYPESKVLLSVRDPESWYESSDATVFRFLRRPGQPVPAELAGWLEMVHDMCDERLPGLHDGRAAAIAAYERHNRAVRDRVPADRLIEWKTGEGWAPLCEALGVPEPDMPFPHANTRAEWLARVEGM